MQSGSYFGTDLRPYIPVADGMLRFFDQFYRARHKAAAGAELDANGRLVLHPGNAVESHAGTTNDAPTVAGLTALADALLALPADAAPAERRAFWSAFRATLPPVPVRDWKGVHQLAPAQAWESQRPDFNMELPHLYPVFPFRLYGVGLPDLDLARNAFHFGDTCPAKQKGHFCWYQAGIFAAGLGLTETAREYALARFLHPRPGDPVEHNHWATQNRMSPWELRFARKDWEVPRYPAFWDGMIFCGRPDMDHGGAGMVQLQEMLLQTPGDALHLFPAWPADWDVDFKLHAPRQTTVEASLRDGKLVNLKVTPESRAKDVVNWLGRVPADTALREVGARKPVTASSTWHEAGYEAARANDADVMTRWASAAEARDAVLEIALGEGTPVSRVWLAEVDFALTREFVIEVRQGGAWKEVARGGEIGPDRAIDFAPVQASAVRLRILRADGPLNVNEFQVFGP
ncbi:MAG: discoidin domain-containing protein [Kiritimatiellia bacterium]